MMDTDRTSRSDRTTSTNATTTTTNTTGSSTNNSNNYDVDGDDEDHESSHGRSHARERVRHRHSRSRSRSRSPQSDPDPASDVHSSASFEEDETNTENFSVDDLDAVDNNDRQQQRTQTIGAGILARGIGDTDDDDNGDRHRANDADNRHSVHKDMTLDDLQHGTRSRIRDRMTSTERARMVQEIRRARSKERKQKIQERLRMLHPHYRRGGEGEDEECFPPHFWPVLEEAVAGLPPEEYKIKGETVAIYHHAAAAQAQPSRSRSGSRNRSRSKSPAVTRGAGVRRKASSPVKRGAGRLGQGARQAASHKPLSSSMRSSTRDDILYGSGSGSASRNRHVRLADPSRAASHKPSSSTSSISKPHHWEASPRSRYGVDERGQHSAPSTARSLDSSSAVPDHATESLYAWVQGGGGGSTARSIAESEDADDHVDGVRIRRHGRVRERYHSHRDVRGHAERHDAIIEDASSPSSLSTSSDAELSAHSEHEHEHNIRRMLRTFSRQLPKRQRKAFTKLLHQLESKQRQQPRGRKGSSNQKHHRLGRGDDVEDPSIQRILDELLIDGLDGTVPIGNATHAENGDDASLVELRALWRRFRDGDDNAHYNDGDDEFNLDRSPSERKRKQPMHHTRHQPDPQPLPPMQHHEAEHEYTSWNGTTHATQPKHNPSNDEQKEEAINIQFDESSSVIDDIEVSDSVSQASFRARSESKLSNQQSPKVEPEQQKRDALLHAVVVPPDSPFSRRSPAKQLHILASGGHHSSNSSDDESDDDDDDGLLLLHPGSKKKVDLRSALLNSHAGATSSLEAETAWYAKWQQKQMERMKQKKSLEFGGSTQSKSPVAGNRAQHSPSHVTFSQHVAISSPSSSSNTNGLPVASSTFSPSRSHSAVHRAPLAIPIAIAKPAASQPSPLSQPSLHTIESELANLRAAAQSFRQQRDILVRSSSSLLQLASPSSNPFATAAAAVATAPLSVPTLSNTDPGSSQTGSFASSLPYPHIRPYRAPSHKLSRNKASTMSVTGTSASPIGARRSSSHKLKVQPSSSSQQRPLPAAQNIDVYLASLQASRRRDIHARAK